MNAPFGAAQLLQWSGVVKQRQQSNSLMCGVPAFAGQFSTAGEQAQTSASCAPKA
jgi:hypothetical protein